MSEVIADLATLKLVDLPAQLRGERIGCLARHQFRPLLRQLDTSARRVGARARHCLPIERCKRSNSPLASAIIAWTVHPAIFRPGEVKAVPGS